MTYQCLSRPRLHSVLCLPLSLANHPCDCSSQFEPRFIQVFEASATVSNREVGVTLRLRAGAVPNVELSGAQDQFTQQTAPSL
eukprot:5953935-Pleurochrysis_carterae.AAC.1